MHFVVWWYWIVLVCNLYLFSIWCFKMENQDNLSDLLSERWLHALVLITNASLWADTSLHHRACAEAQVKRETGRAA